jgi:hypothetical protein
MRNKKQNWGQWKRKEKQCKSYNPRERNKDNKVNDKGDRYAGS